MPIISPIQPTSALNILPSTPVEHMMEKNTPAATPTDQQDSKSNNASPFMSAAPSSVEPPSSVEVKKEVMVNTPAGCGSGSHGNGSNGSINSRTSNMNANADTCNGMGTSASTSAVNNISSEMKHILSLLKRPMLASRDYEDIVDDDSTSRQLLYDYSTLEAWMNYPVKRYKPNDENKLAKKARGIRDLYAAHQNERTQQSLADEAETPALLNDGEPSIKIEQNVGDGTDNCGEMMELHEIKKEIVDTDADSKTNIENLFTSKGLVASFKDLDQIFDNTDDSPLGVSIDFSSFFYC